MRSYHVHSVMLIKVTLGQQRVKGLKGPKGAFLLRQPGSIAVETFAYGALEFGPLISANRLIH